MTIFTTYSVKVSSRFLLIEGIRTTASATTEMTSSVALSGRVTNTEKSPEDISKARRLLNYQPTTKIKDGIPKFVDWFLARERARG